MAIPPLTRDDRLGIPRRLELVNHAAPSLVSLVAAPASATARRTLSDFRPAPLPREAACPKGNKREVLQSRHVGTLPHLGREGRRDFGCTSVRSCPSIAWPPPHRGAYERGDRARRLGAASAHCRDDGSWVRQMLWSYGDEGDVAARVVPPGRPTGPDSPLRTVCSSRLRAGDFPRSHRVRCAV
jgi:hypothetical protein